MMVNNGIVFALLLVGCFVVGFILSIIYSKATFGKKIKDAESKSERFLQEARREADAIKKEAEFSAKDKIFQAKSEAEKELKERRIELNQLDKRLRHREEILDRKLEQSDRREQNYNKRERELGRKEKVLTDKDEHLEKLIKKEDETLERISGLSKEDAKNEFLKKVEEEAAFEAAKLAKKIEDEAVETADRKSKEILSVAIQRYASDYVSDNTISAVNLPNDEMKGRIIGREGRNIRALEAITGVELIIDDTPETVILSSFDPVRREIARISLERLIADGRIHPARIEEIVEKVKKEIEAAIREEGDKAIFELGLHGIHPEMIKLIGRLRYRTSYAQNVLQHSKEVAYLTGLMAGELGADIKFAKRAGIMHDIGKAVDHEIEGSHQFIGANIAKKFGENGKIVNAIEVHHGEGEPSTVEGALVAAADALSAARPGARKETLESYIKRLEKLEEIATSFNGINKCYAIQAGREIRIMVKPEEVNDDLSAQISRNLAKKIEEELSYPGQIKVTVIRESRYIQYAK
jgi:ribonuclease Y